MLKSPSRGLLWRKITQKFIREAVACSSRTFALSPDTALQRDRDVIKKAKNRIFDDEKKRQASLVARVEKIEVLVKDIKPEPSEVTLIMNKDISTPFNCAQHIHEQYTNSVVAELDEGKLWDMHRPLESGSSLRFRHFKDDNPYLVNQVFWRSCSFILGMVIETAFKDYVPVIRHSWPKPDIKSGSFVYDVALPSLANWKATDSELRTLTAVLWKIKEKAIKFERLDVGIDIAQEIFVDNQYKTSQLQNISNSSDKVTLYRLEDHIDISVGPMIANTSLVGRANLAAIHKIESADGPLYRFQGIAIPQQLFMAHYAYQILCKRAKKLNNS